MVVFVPNQAIEQTQQRQHLFVGLWALVLPDEAGAAQGDLEFDDEVLEGAVDELPHLVVYSILHPIQESIPDNQIEVVGGLHLQEVLISGLFGQSVLDKLLTEVSLEDLVRNKGKQPGLPENLGLLLLLAHLH